MKTNHHLNARAHHEKWCPECNAFDDQACRDENGRARAPHRMRALMRSGELIVIHKDDARAGRKVHALIKLAGQLAPHARKAGRFIL